MLLEDQDRSLWNRDLIAEGRTLVARALSTRRAGSYTIQAAIGAVHASAATAAATDWNEIVSLYDVLLAIEPTAIVELNRAVAVGMARGPAAGLAIVDTLTAEPSLREYHLLPSARGDLLTKLGRWAEARAEFERAASLTRNARQRDLLSERAADCARRA